MDALLDGNLQYQDSELEEEVSTNMQGDFACQKKVSNDRKKRSSSTISIARDNKENLMSKTLAKQVQTKFENTAVEDEAT